LYVLSSRQLGCERGRAVVSPPKEKSVTSRTPQFGQESKKDMRARILDK
jgi:hypothetical protein